MTTRTHEFRQLQIIKALHHGFEHIGRNHVAHDAIVIEHRDRPSMGAIQNGRGVFL
ncbi:hypothetical protein D3C85_1457830 [compost metagenome]